jgi:hypothetical protein
MTRIKLDDDTSIVIKKVGNKFKVTLDADVPLSSVLSGDFSAIVTRKDLIHVRDSVTKLLEED